MNLRYCAISIALTCLSPVTGRDFVHPGATYSQSDLDRMRAMVESRQEPYYSTFLKLKDSSYSRFVERDRGTSIPEGKFNQTIGDDGRRAHDMALLWHITGDNTYADNVVKILNWSSRYTNTSSRGTAALDNGKIYLLIEAAELMRDYPGWAEEDKQRFKDMLVYPGYSDTEVPESHYSLNDDENDVTFYWNIYNFDASRFGNQGLFAARTMMAMGVFLDNEKIYDRAYRYLTGQPHRSDDLPYVAGPPVTSTTPYPLDTDNPTAGDNTTSFMLGYKLTGRENRVEDYGYDEQLRYYIYPNGQSQEACRDQDHAMVGTGLFVDIAEIAWNQGDNLYGELDNRILAGLEWAFRYNLSYIENPADAWEPAGYTRDENETAENPELFYQVRSRSGRWESVAPSTKGRGDSFMGGGNRECALAHYAVRAGLDPQRWEWTGKYRDFMIENYGCEGYGKDSNHAYEWAGWGTLTKRRENDMAGDPGRWNDGKFVPRIHTTDEEINCADYDRHGDCASGHTCSGNYETGYRCDGQGMNITVSNGKNVVSSLAPDDWMNYTVLIPTDGEYDITITHRGNETSECSIGNGRQTVTLPASQNFVTTKTGSVSLPAGVAVIKLATPRPGADLQLASMRIAPAQTTSLSDILNEPQSIITVNGNSVMTSGDGGITAYDTLGRMAASTPGRSLTLEPGLYILHAAGSQPVKAIIR